MLRALCFTASFTYNVLHCFAGDLPPLPAPLSLEPTPAACQCLTCDCVDCTCANQSVDANKMVSVMKPAVTTEKPAETAEKTLNVSNTHNLITDLGYGHPPTLAPLVTEIALNRPKRAATPALNPVRKAIAAPLGYRRVFAGTVCQNGVCTPQYRWEPIPKAATVQVPPQPEPVRAVQPLRRLRRWRR